MKKMILVLAGAIIAGGAIFAIQSYASSQDTPLNESEINKLKSTDPKNNNRLTADMWDQMLDFFKKINARLGVMQKQLNDLDYTSSSWDSKQKIETIVKEVVNRRYYMCNWNGVECTNNEDVYEKSLTSKPNFFTDGRNAISQAAKDAISQATRDTISQKVRGALIGKSKKLWTHNFCALTTVASNGNKHICHLFTAAGEADQSQGVTKTARFLYENSNSGEDGFCHVICF